MLCHSFVVYVFNAFVSIVSHACFVFLGSWFVVGLIIIIYLGFFAVRVNGWSMCDISGVSVFSGWRQLHFSVECPFGCCLPDSGF